MLQAEIDRQRTDMAPLETLVSSAQALSLAKQRRDLAVDMEMKAKSKDKISDALTKARDDGRPLEELLVLAQTLSVM